MHESVPQRGGTTRRTVLTAGLTGAAAITFAAGPAAAVARALPASASRPLTAAWFARPAAQVRPKFRWWWPDGLVDPVEIAREIDQIADAGFGGMEIAAVHHSVKDKSVLDPEHHGWGSRPWRDGVEAALRRAARRGVTIDLTVGPSWPAAVPGLSPDDPAAAQELVLGRVALTGGAAYRGPVPAPGHDPAAGVSRQRLIAVQAARVDTANSTRKETGLDAATVRDLTRSVVDGALSWTPPDDGDWVLLSYWQRGSAQQPESGPHSVPAAHVVDHFAAAGTAAVTGHWDRHILTPSLRTLLRAAGGAFFEDSVELETDGLNWTSRLPEEFERHTGRPLLPYLPAIVLDRSNQVFAFEAQLTRQIRHDFWETVSLLFNRHHLGALRDWAHGLRMELRSQPYGLQTDAIASAAVLDIPEGESLGFKNLDDYRCLAGGRDMAGHTVLSCEAGAYNGSAYSTTWDRFLRTMGGAYAAGVNQTVLHGFSYATAPKVAWPGFAAFSPYNGSAGYGESWGPRQPTWRHVSDVAGHLARVHQVLQTGKARADVAVFRQTGYTATGIGASWFTSTGVPLGWTHQFLSGPLLSLPSATVRGGRLAPEGPAYKALFVEGDFFSASAPTLSLDDARSVLALARAGLPVVLLGDFDRPVTPGVPAAGENARLTDVLDRLLALPNVRRITDKTAVGDALAALKVTADVRHSVASTLLNAHRVTGDADFYYFCNGKHAETVKPPVAPIDHEVTVRRTARGSSRATAVPYLLDPWSGTVVRLGRYTRDGDDFTLRLRLQPGQNAIVALGGPGLLGDRDGRRPYATGTDADEVRFAPGGLAVRATAPGRYVTRLSTGRSVTTSFPSVPEPVTPSSWRLEVEDWRPGTSATETERIRRELVLDTLLPWSGIPGLADSAGIGRYRTTVVLPAHWDASHGATLQLGQVSDTFRVTVNGRALPPADRLDPVVDLGGALRRGPNEIVVEVAVPLINRLRVAQPEVFGGVGRQDHGLVGPVRIVPYRQTVIA
ncbi:MULTISPECIES: glycosyl hydrolase [Streptomyces]|uniref:Glycosyl hydrolase n=1 Tax=Streptomyces doudnae TaxID=3075536 RepID=A0ABD5ERU2_9ACTN|nr:MULTISPECIES: glycosyl hydrolase [unclassified Streptomyces]MDT0437432.1 glycosyl hydrolase [Streptomyces sp. DSM 41981]MYQ67012.1 alpha-L-rhamnosidase [Streptomyces sp. SID4950]SCE28721.1 alpha-L-rhamnosidase [Streptomyces sp. SolWspMP-5a-2]